MDDPLQFLPTLPATRRRLAWTVEPEFFTLRGKLRELAEDKNLKIEVDGTIGKFLLRYSIILFTPLNSLSKA